MTASKMPWFRFYSEVLNDAKVQKLSPTMFKHWVNILCLANDGDTRGVLPPLDDVAFKLRLSNQTAMGVLDFLVEAGLLDWEEGGLRPHKWEERQFASDNVTARVQKHRAKPASNVSVTLHVTPPETETETETESESDPEQRTEPDATVLRSARDLLGREELTSGEELMAGKLAEYYSAEDVAYAFKEAAELNRLSLGYVTTICKRLGKAVNV